MTRSKLLALSWRGAVGIAALGACLAVGACSFVWRSLAQPCFGYFRPDLTAPVDSVRTAADIAYATPWQPSGFYARGPYGRPRYAAGRFLVDAHGTEHPQRVSVELLCWSCDDRDIHVYDGPPIDPSTFAMRVNTHWSPEPRVQQLAVTFVVPGITGDRPGQPWRYLPPVLPGEPLDAAHPNAVVFIDWTPYPIGTANGKANVPVGLATALLGLAMWRLWRARSYFARVGSWRVGTFAAPGRIAREDGTVVAVYDAEREAMQSGPVIYSALEVDGRDARLPAYADQVIAGVSSTIESRRLRELSLVAACAALSGVALAWGIVYLAARVY